MKACMTPDEWAEWSDANDRIVAGKEPRAVSPCEDCTVRFAVLMRLEGRCDGWPETRVGERVWKPSGDERQDRRRSQWRDAKQRQRMRARAT